MIPDQEIIESRIRAGGDGGEGRGGVACCRDETEIDRGDRRYLIGLNVLRSQENKQRDF